MILVNKKYELEQCLYSWFKMTVVKKKRKKKGIRQFDFFGVTPLAGLY